MAGFPSVKKGNKIGEKAKRPMKGTPLDKNQVMELLKRYHGNVSKTADSMGCARSSIQRLIDQDEEIANARHQARERFIDELEECTWNRAVEGNDTTLQLFLLKTQARSRGYEQSEAQHMAKDIATAAFDFIVNKSKNPAEPSK